jgi:hypothetical protein
LTSSEGSITRGLGAVLLDDKDQTMFIASDEPIQPRDPITPPAGRSLSIIRNSHGVFKGRLQDIDNLDLWTTVFEAKTSAYFFKEKGNMFIFCGNQGELGLSFDKGVTWITEDLGDRYPASNFFGETKGLVVIDQYIIVRK